MSWIFLTISAQLINAVVAILDKYLVTDEKAIPRPFVYALYTCLATAAWAFIYLIAFIPGASALGIPSLENIFFPSLTVISLALLSAVAFFIAIYTLYKALRAGGAADVMPVVGATSAVSSFLFAWLFLQASYSGHFIIGILLLVAGTLLVSRLHFSVHTFLTALGSGAFFALHYLIMKGLFMETSFDDGFFWSRLALVVVALACLVFPSTFKTVTKQTSSVSHKTGWLVIINKVLAGVAAFMILKATDWGDVAVVQALDGLKFVFILLISIPLSDFLPLAAREQNLDFKSNLRRILYVFIICIGLAVLFI